MSGPTTGVPLEAGKVDVIDAIQKRDNELIVEQCWEDAQLYQI